VLIPVSDQLPGAIVQVQFLANPAMQEAGLKQRRRRQFLQRGGRRYHQGSAAVVEQLAENGHALHFHLAAGCFGVGQIEVARPENQDRVVNQRREVRSHSPGPQLVSHEQTGPTACLGPQLPGQPAL